MAEGIAAAHREAPEDAGLFALYLAGTPFAEADARKLNAGGALLSRALLKVSGASEIALTAASVEPLPLESSTFRGMICVPQSTPAPPTPLLPVAARMPVTCVADISSPVAARF